MQHCSMQYEMKILRPGSDFSSIEIPAILLLTELIEVGLWKPRGINSTEITLSTVSYPPMGASGMLIPVVPQEIPSQQQSGETKPAPLK